MLFTSFYTPFPHPGNHGFEFFSPGLLSNNRKVLRSSVLHKLQPNNNFIVDS